MGKGGGRKRQVAGVGAPSKPLPAQGKGANKRTPSSAFDPAAGSDIYQAEKIVGVRRKNLGGGNSELQYEVKWANWESKHNTYEPLRNLAGCESMIAEYEERKRQKDAKLEAAEREKKRQKQEEEEKKRLEAAAAAAAARVAAQDQGGAAGTPPAAADVKVEGAGKAPGPAKGTRRTNPCWNHFSEEGAKPGYAHCMLPHPKKLGEVCNESICIKWGPAALKNHLQYVHPAEYMRCCQPCKPLGQAEAQPGVLALPVEKRDKLHKAHALWLVKSKRPLNLVEDKEYRALWLRATGGAYTPPDRTTVRGHVLMLSREGQERAVSINTALTEAGIKPAAAGDIWSDRASRCSASASTSSTRTGRSVSSCSPPRPSRMRATPATPSRGRPRRRSTAWASWASSTSASSSR